MFGIVRLFVLLAVASQATSSVLQAQDKFPSTWEEFTLHHRTMDNLFNFYKKRFNKSFSSDQDEKTHFQNFVSQVKDIFDWNDAKNEAGRSYVKAINRFTDLSVEERKKFVMPETKATVSVSCLYVCFTVFNRVLLLGSCRSEVIGSED
jgi:hypothetical protein